LCVCVCVCVCVVGGGQRSGAMNSTPSTPGYPLAHFILLRNASGRMIRSDLGWYWNKLKMKASYREKNLLDNLFGGFGSTLKISKINIGFSVQLKIKKSQTQLRKSKSKSCDKWKIQIWEWKSSEIWKNKITISKFEIGNNQPIKTQKVADSYMRINSEIM